MSTATGYYRPGTSWLHRRHPITKLLAVAFILLATFLLPSLVLPILAAVLVVVAFLVLVTFLFTTLADDLLESLVSRGVSHRIAFIVLSAVQMVPRMQER